MRPGVLPAEVTRQKKQIRREDFFGRSAGDIINKNFLKAPSAP
jgi:hypothetical protein